MATDLANPSNTLAKIRWREQYVSDGLNKKLNGIAPTGIIRGGRLVAHPSINDTVTVEADDEYGDSIYTHVNANGQQLTFRQVGDINFDLSAEAGNQVYVGLDVIYSTSADTEIYWRAYSQAEIDADPTIIVLGWVDVPGVSGLIPSDDVRNRERMDAGLTLSSGMRDWRQVIPNASFEFSRAFSVTAGNTSRNCPGWWMNPGSAGSTHISSTESHTGELSLRLEGAGGGAHQMSVTSSRLFPVRGGQTLKVSMWWKAVGVTLGAGASASVGLWVEAKKRDGSSVSAGTAGDFSFFSIWMVTEDGTVVTGSVDWTELTAKTIVPPDAEWIEVNVILVDGTSFAGDIYIDDVNAWVEPGPVADYYDRREDALVEKEQWGTGLVVSPQWGQDGVISSVSDLFYRSLRLHCESASSPPEYRLGNPIESISSWLLNIRRGQIQLGEDWVSTYQSAIRPRLLTPFADGTVSDYTLLWEAEVPGAATPIKVRFYATKGGYWTVSQGLCFVVNAYWDGSQWVRDVSSSSYQAYRLDFGPEYGLECYRYFSGNNPAWSDADWNDLADGNRIFSFLGAPSDMGSLIEFLNPQINFESSTTYTNVPKTTTPIPNLLCAKNLPKAWVRCSWVSAAPPIIIPDSSFSDSFNVDEVEVTASDIRVKFKTPFGVAASTNNYVAMATVGVGGASGPVGVGFHVGGTVNQANLSFFACGAATRQDPSADSLFLEFIAFGEQDS
jgi:hypothetical protein